MSQKLDNIIKRRLKEIAQSDPIRDLAEFIHNTGITELELVNIINSCKDSVPLPLLNDLHNRFRDLG